MDESIDAAFDPPPLPLSEQAPGTRKIRPHRATSGRDHLPAEDRAIATWTAQQLAASDTLVVAGSVRYRRAKRALDVTVAVVGLLLAAPLILLLALAVRLDSPGPAFFLQRRVGQRGRVFRIIKLRSMAGADPGWTGPSNPADEERITRVGRFLRRWSLDELPQLVNVLRGEMSLVGPRPERPEIVLARYQSWQFQRFLVPQGMTGWWQVTGRGRTALCDHTEDDLYYIARASLGFDLRILWLTLPAVVRHARHPLLPSGVADIREV